MKPRVLPVLAVLALFFVKAVPASERKSESIAPGLTHHVLSKGKAATSKSYRNSKTPAHRE